MYLGFLCIDLIYLFKETFNFKECFANVKQVIAVIGNTELR
jgi:hypothetical protein